MTVLTAIGCVLALCVLWSARDLAGIAPHPAALTTLVGIATTGLAGAAAVAIAAGSLPAGSIAVAAAIALPVGLWSRRPPRALRIVATGAQARVPPATGDRRAA